MRFLVYYFCYKRENLVFTQTQSKVVVSNIEKVLLKLFR